MKFAWKKSLLSEKVIDYKSNIIVAYIVMDQGMSKLIAPSQAHSVATEVKLRANRKRTLKEGKGFLSFFFLF